MPASDISASIREGLRDSADLFEKELKAKIKSEDKLSSKISDSIIKEGPFQSGEGFHIDIIVGGKQAPMALAFEFGSGEYATRGKRGKYRIPNEGGVDFVAFPKERWPGYQPPPDREFFVFPFVMHPGVRPVPYVVPTIKKTTPEIAKILGASFISGYTKGIAVRVVIR